MATPVEGRRVVVLGLARQGTALAHWLIGHGARVTVSDVQPADRLRGALKALEGLAIRYELGGHPSSLLVECDLLCLSGGVPIDLPIVQEARKRGIALSNDAQLFLERCPAAVIGITGSAGKTTTTTLVGDMGRSAGRTTWIGGNIGNPLISDLAAMTRSDLVVMELSSFQLDLMTVSPPVAAVLNVTPNHLDRHGTMAAYVAAKARILDYQSPPDTAVLGYDDPVARSLIGRAKGRLTLFGRSGVGDWADLAHTRVDEGWVVLLKDQRVPICELSEIRLRGVHNVLNVLAACALADAAGISPQAMRHAISAFAGVEHRLQLVRERSGVQYYDDSIATAPERVIAALHSFQEPIVLLVGGRDKHLPWAEAAQLIVNRVRQLILFGEMAELVQRSIAEVTWRDSLEAVHRVVTLAEAVRKAAEVARPGDVVLLSPGGTSFDAFKDFAERGDKFQEYVRAL
ncbi:MAG TPA: UDP-N-acetylmuramoyl-L-alanine--D-glutamate ligase [Anaerolineae bacterium]|nr:UDP-N-acetylmuramoyl-L-alanine--D-glutamate ligase [Anaerolineae bacterium]